VDGYVPLVGANVTIRQDTAYTEHEKLDEPRLKNMSVAAAHDFIEFLDDLPDLSLV
jgi:hypothetical protein